MCVVVGFLVGILFVLFRCGVRLAHSTTLCFSALQFFLGFQNALQTVNC